MNKQTAKMVRALFIFERRQWENRRMTGNRFSTYLPGRHWDGHRKRKSIWPTVAQRLASASVSPYGYIPYVCASYRFIDNPPSPNQLLNNELIYEYSESTKWDSYHVRRKWSASARNLRSQMSLWCGTRGDETVTESALKTGLLLRDQGVTAIYRFCFATACGFDDIAEEFRIEAAREYTSARRGHDRALSEDLFPSTWRRVLVTGYDSYLMQIMRQPLQVDPIGWTANRVV